MDETPVWTETYTLDEFSAAPENGLPTALEATYYPGAVGYDAFSHDGDPEVKWVFLLTDSQENTYEETLEY